MNKAKSNGRWSFFSFSNFSFYSLAPSLNRLLARPSCMCACLAYDFSGPKREEAEEEEKKQRTPNEINGNLNANSDHLPLWL